MNLRSSLLAVGLCIAGLTVALGVAEAVLRLSGPSAQAQHMDPGLIEHHPRFGWQLARNWQGTHVHDDYTAEYRTTPFRTRTTGGVAHGAGELVLIGDSFTFGLGVTDDATFAALLQGVAEHPISNHGLPGTSPDQHLLRLEPMNLGRTRQLVMVIYPGNDLLDLTRTVPLQAPHSKPRYELRANRLSVRNVPVPKAPQEPAASHRSITEYLLEGSEWDQPLALLRLLVTLAPPSGAELAPWFESRFETERGLLDAIVARTELSLRSRSVRLTVAVLPGREVYANPDSVLASFQRQATGWVTASSERRGISMVDLTPTLSAADYFPVDGHLNERGHCRVAAALSRSLGYPIPQCTAADESAAAD